MSGKQTKLILHSFCRNFNVISCLVPQIKLQLHSLMELFNHFCFLLQDCIKGALEEERKKHEQLTKDVMERAREEMKAYIQEQRQVRI